MRRPRVSLEFGSTRAACTLAFEPLVALLVGLLLLDEGERVGCSVECAEHLGGLVVQALHPVRAGTDADATQVVGGFMLGGLFRVFLFLDA